MKYGILGLFGGEKGGFLAMAACHFDTVICKWYGNVLIDIREHPSQLLRYF
jgi:hypothetical protein